MCYQDNGKVCPHSRHFQKQYQKPVGRSVDGGRRGLILKENNSQIG
jgi:hypothetical protein